MKLTNQEKYEARICLYFIVAAVLIGWYCIHQPNNPNRLNSHNNPPENVAIVSNDRGKPHQELRPGMREKFIP